MLYKANDKYNANLSQSYTVSDTTLYVDAVPDNVPTIVVADYGGDNETVFYVTAKTSNSLTGVSRLKGANVNLDNTTTITCINNEEFINQFISTGIDPWYDESDGATITFDIVNGKKQRVTIADDRTINITGVTPGQPMLFRITQDGTGGHTITWDGGLTLNWMTDDAINETASAVTTYLFVQTATDTYDAYKTGETQ